MTDMHKSVFLFCFCVYSCAVGAQADTMVYQYKDYWSKERTYFYAATYSDSLGQTITYDTIILHPTGVVWSVDPKQTIMDFRLHFTAEDSARLAPFPKNGVQRAWSRVYTEGVLQKNNRVWMHPVRSNQYLLTEIAPFPEARLPLFEGKKWNTALDIFESFGTFQGELQAIYEVTAQTTFSNDHVSMLCWVIKSVATHNTLGNNFADYSFNPEYGFVQMKYRFYNGETMEFNLIDMQLEKE